MDEFRDAVRRGYDELAPTFEAERSPDRAEEALLEGLVDQLPREARVLDAGCGHGVPVLRGLRDRVEVVGLDFSRAQLRRARRNAPGPALVSGDMTALPCGDGVFDAITAFHSLIHVPASAQPDAIGEFARTLRPGGLLLASIGGTPWEGSNPDWLGSGVEMHWSIPGRERSESHLAAAGFEVLDDWRVDDDLGDGGSFTFLLAPLDGE